MGSISGDVRAVTLVPHPITYEQARQLEGRCIDAVMDYDAAHGTFTLCIVWRESEKANAGVR